MHLYKVQLLHPTVAKAVAKVVLQAVQDKDIRENISGVLHHKDWWHTSGVLKALIDAIRQNTGLTAWEDSFKVRVNPTAADSVAPHVDLDYIIDHLQPREQCISCMQPLTEKQQVAQSGIHWDRPECKQPIRPRAYTVAVNLGE